MGLRQAAPWTAGSDIDFANVEKRDVYDLIPIISVPTGRRVVGTWWVNKLKAEGT